MIYIIKNTIKDIMLETDNLQKRKTEKLDEVELKSIEINQHIEDKKINNNNHETVYKNKTIKDIDIGNKNNNKKNNTNKIKINNKNINNDIIMKKQEPNISNRKNNKNLNNEIMIYNIAEDESGRNFINSNTNKQNIVETTNKMNNYIENELNLLPYELSLQYDTRTYLSFYISLLKLEHILLFLFFNKEEYNSLIIKFDLLFVIFIINYGFNALFYDNNTIHNIYAKKGSYDIIYQLPSILYSSILTLILIVLFKFMVLTEKGILKLKINKISKNIKREGKNVWKAIRIKFVLYFAFSSILLIFFWYYISMFNAVFKNSQFYLLKDTLISFALILFYPFIIYLISACFRITALSDNKKSRKYFYTLSQMFQIF